MFKIGRAIKSYIRTNSGIAERNAFIDKVFRLLWETLSLFNKKTMKLYMTLLVKDEEDIIRENILFHRAMGVDGFIVTDNNSSDRTVKILEELKAQGIPIEIIHEPEMTYYQNRWVDRMIKIARDKYKADWVINSDADEFWYSVSLNLKRDISRYGRKANVLQTFLINFYPSEERKDFFKSSYFIKRNLQPFEQEKLGIIGEHFPMECFRTKVIHKTKGYKKIAMGNHSVEMKQNKEEYNPYIKIYHYMLRNYEHFERKVINGGKGYKNYPNLQRTGRHWRMWYDLYKQGCLKEAYKKEFAFKDFDKLFDYGVVAKDNSVYSYMKNAGILE